MGDQKMGCYFVGMETRYLLVCEKTRGSYALEIVSDCFKARVRSELVHRLISERHTAVGDSADFQEASGDHT